MSKSMPIRTVTINLKDDYDGFTVEMQTNVSYEIKNMLNSGEMDSVLEALSILILSWNLADKDGKDIALPKNGTVMTKDIPDEVLAEIINGYREALREKTQVPLVSSEPSKTT